MLGRTLTLFFALFVLSACQEYQVVAVKDFRIYAETQDPALKKAIKTLAQRYNKDMSSQTLTIVDREEDSNSRIRFTSGLHDSGHKLGLGKWITTTQRKSTLTIKGEKNTQTVAYAMDIEFDLENFKSKVDSLNDSTSEEAQHLYHLFCHEIGHGLQMDHSPENSSVMYPTIPDRPIRYVDYKAYFNRARSFMSSH
jgi:predicted Zn-dependent protease